MIACRLELKGKNYGKKNPQKFRNPPLASRSPTDDDDDARGDDTLATMSTPPECSSTAVLKDCALFFASLVVLQGGTFVPHVGVAGYALSIMSTLTYILMRRQVTLSSASAEEADGHQTPLKSSFEAPSREKV